MLLNLTEQGRSTSDGIHGKALRRSAGWVPVAKAGQRSKSGLHGGRCRWDGSKWRRVAKHVLRRRWPRVLRGRHGGNRQWSIANAMRTQGDGSSRDSHALGDACRRLRIRPGGDHDVAPASRSAFSPEVRGSWLDAKRCDPGGGSGYARQRRPQHSSRVSRRSDCWSGTSLRFGRWH